jgi:hypothetical protein
LNSNAETQRRREKENLLGLSPCLRVSVFAFLGAVAVGSGAWAGERWLERPETGPVAVSIANELSQVYRRAEVWLGAQKETKDGRRETEGMSGVGGLSAEELWAAVEGKGEGGVDAFAAAVALARALDAEGAEIVFRGGEPVEWRKALVRVVVARQRVEAATGGGYWAGSREDSPEEKLRATRLALEALSIASGVGF